MAGIGFELKKLFAKRGVLNGLRAYGYAAIVCTGPMLLGVILLMGIRYVGQKNGAAGLEQDLLNSILTYTLLASLMVTSLFSILTTRYTADMLFIEKKERILPSLYGSTILALAIGCPLYGFFLSASGIESVHQLLALIFFLELVVVWMQINYMTAIKDYKSILLAFFTSIFAALCTAFLLSRICNDKISALLIAVIIGYGMMMTWYFVLMHQYFPKGEGSAFMFLRLIDLYPQLLLIGIFINLGLFGHLVIMWFSPLRVQVKGLFYWAPAYDVPALFAFLSILVTTVNFVTSVEVNFYPSYRQYFSLLNGQGTLADIQRTETEMLMILKHELFYLALKQVFTTVVFIVIGGPLLMNLGVGFNESMTEIYRILCVGYGMFAIANSIMLIQLYFADNRGALFTSMMFMVFSNLGTILLMDGIHIGVGFLLGGFFMYLASWLGLNAFTNRVDYHVLCAQPPMHREHAGYFTRLTDYLDKISAKKPWTRKKGVKNESIA